MDSFNKKSIIFSCFYLVLFGGLIYFVFMPALSRLKQNKATFDQKQQVLRNNYDKIESLQKIEKNPKEFDTLSTAVNELWPDNQDISKFIVQIESVAKDSNLVIDNFSVVESTVKKQKATDDSGNASSSNTKTKTDTGTKFSLAVKSPYSNIIDLIGKMETMARLNAISSIDMNYIDESTINLKLTGGVYYGK